MFPHFMSKVEENREKAYQVNHEFKDMGGSCKEQGKGVEKLQRKIIIKKNYTLKKTLKTTE